MARLPRLALAGQPHLIAQHARQPPAFGDDADRRAYLDALGAAARACGVALHAYALTDAAAVLLATPLAADSLGRCLQQLGRRYVAAFNRRHGRSGALWQGRFQAAPVSTDRHFLLAMRYVEQAPVRTGGVAQAAEAPASSAAHHLGRAHDPRVAAHPLQWALGNTPFEREARHAEQLGRLLSADEVDLIERALRRGWMYGPPHRQEPAATAAGTPRALAPRPRGRPPRKSPGRRSL